MNVDLVFFDRISGQDKRGFSFTCLNLARRLQDEGLLHRLICLEAGSDTGIPAEKILALSDDFGFRMADLALAKGARRFRGFDARLRREILFDRFISRRLERIPGNLLFFSRPLFPDSALLARESGMKVWVQSSIPHPLINFALVRNEEFRLGLPQFGAYSNIERAERLARIYSVADKAITLGPEIAEYTYRTYEQMLGKERILPLENLFSLDTEDFRPLSGQRRRIEKGAPITFLHLSHINLIKGIPYLLDAWKQFQSKGHDNCRLVLVGRMDQNVERLIRERYADLPRFEHRGYVPDLLQAYADSDVFISSSISDNGPGTIVEAMAAGMPVVSSRNCGLATLVSEAKNGHTYAYNDVDRLDEILQWYAENPEQILPLGEVARQTADRLVVDRYPNEILGFLRDHGAQP